MTLGGIKWNVSFFRTWVPRMGFRSTLRYRDYLKRREERKSMHGTLALDVRKPFQGAIVLREVGSDQATFHEVLVNDVYRSLRVHGLQFENVIDLGANIGLASLYFSALSPTCRIFCVEPHPETYKVLVRNVASLGARCRTLKAAVWSRKMSLAAIGKTDHYSAFSVRERSEEDDGSIAGMDMPTIIERSGFESVDLLKVDIEGAELELFKGDLDWLEKVKAIAIEFHGSSRKDSRFDDLMEIYGFSIPPCESDHTVLAVRGRAERRA